MNFAAYGMGDIRVLHKHVCMRVYFTPPFQPMWALWLMKRAENLVSAF